MVVNEQKKKIPSLLFWKKSNFVAFVWDPLIGLGKKKKNKIFDSVLVVSLVVSKRKKKKRKKRKRKRKKK